MLRAFIACSALSLPGCGLPYQQLSLPSPVGPPHGQPGMTTGSVRGSVPLGAVGDAGTDVARVYPGTGVFTNPASSSSAAPATTVTGAGVTLNLENARPSEAAKAILGDILNVPYVVSDKIKGNITLNTVRPVNQDELVRIFEGVLATVDAALIVEGGIYKIVTVDEAIAAGKPLVARGAASRKLVGVATQIIPLRHVAAAEMERILKSIAPQSTITRLDGGGNILMVSGSASDLQSMIETANVFDVDHMRGMSFGIFPVETNDPVAIAQELDVVFGNDKPSATKNIVRFIPNVRLKAVLVMTSRPEYLEKAGIWISRIDLAGKATEKQAFVYHVQHRTAAEVASLLQKVYAPPKAPTAASSSITTGALAQPEAAGEQLALAPNAIGIAGPTPVPAGPVSAANSASSILAPPTSGVADADPDVTNSTGASTVTAAVTPPVPDDRYTGISIIPDETNNAVVISATPGELRRIKQLLRQIDVMPRQILIEATIAEVTLNDDLKFGLRWFFEKGGSEFRLTESALGVIAPAFPGFSYFLNLANVQLAINALATITNVDIVSSPSLMVLDNKKAVLQIGDEVPIATQSAVGVLGPDAPIVNAISFRNTGVILSITPRVSDNDRVLLDIEQEVSDVKPTTSSSIDSPTIQQRRIKTTVTVKNGESIVLAGLMQDRSTRDRGQVPIVGDIPFIGNAFKNKKDTVARTELLIAITPSVMRDDAQVGQIAAEFRDRMNFTTRPQRETPPEHRETLDRLQR